MMKFFKLFLILMVGLTISLTTYSIRGPAFALANTIYVATNGNDTTGDGSQMNPYRTIQKGIDLASIGDTVSVAPGTYSERINLKSGIKVQGSGAANTIIDGQQAGVVVKIMNATNVVLTGFTIRNGKSGQEGGGIFVSNSTDILIEDNVIQDNRTEGAWEQSNGGGLRIINSSVNLQENVIKNNFANFWGGGIYTNLQAQNKIVTIKNNTIEDNTANLYNGGGGVSAHLANGAKVEILNNRIKGNAAGNTGGGIEVLMSGGSLVSIIGNWIEGNYTYTSDNGGGGIYVQGYDANKASAALIANNVIINNYTTGQTRNGGGILLSYGLGPNTLIINNTLVGNQASCGGGIGIYYSDIYSDFWWWGLPGSNPTIANNIIWGNVDRYGHPNDLYGVRAWQWDCANSAPVEANYNLIGSGSYYGNGNITADPLFVDAAGQDYHLKLGSPAIDMGNGSLIPSGLNTDFDGAPRIIGANVDMGAYEYGIPFASFSAKTEAELGSDIAENELEAKGNFTLGQESNWIDPLTENVIIKIGSFETTIPAGSFKWFEYPKKPEKSEWKFEGTIDGVPIEMKIKPTGSSDYEFKFEAEGLGLCWLTSPVEVNVSIGDDFGEIEVVPEVKGLENWESVCPGVPIPPEIQTPGISPD